MLRSDAKELKFYLLDDLHEAIGKSALPNSVTFGTGKVEGFIYAKLHLAPGDTDQIIPNVKLLEE